MSILEPKIAQPQWQMPKPSEASKAHDLILTDKPLSAQMISELMNVHVGIYEPRHRAQTAKPRIEPMSAFFYFGILLSASLFVALLIGLSFLYVHGMGPFSPTQQNRLID